MSKPDPPFQLEHEPLYPAWVRPVSWVVAAVLGIGMGYFVLGGSCAKKAAAPPAPAAAPR